MPNVDELRRVYADLRAASAGIPAPSSAVRFRVLLEIEQARARCDEMLGRRGRSRGVSVTRATPADPSTVVQARRCKGCGGHLDQLDQRCANCIARHEMRRLTAARKAA